MKSRILLSGLLLIVGAALYAQVPEKWVDKDGDGLYDINEFSDIYSKGYNDWDVDGDGRINDEEFYNSSYNRLDVNRDGRLTNEEWTAGARDHNGFIKDDYSQNPPQYLSKREYADRFKNTEYFSSHDINRDGFVDSEEMIQSSFNRLDKNQDGKLDAEEIKNNQ